MRRALYQHGAVLIMEIKRYDFYSFSRSIYLGYRAETLQNTSAGVAKHLHPVNPGAAFGVHCEGGAHFAEVG